MIECNDAFETPDSGVTIYRYMGVDQFMSLISSSKLHFTRLDEFEDKWEGAMPEREREDFVQLARERDVQPEVIKSFFDYFYRFKTTVFANCWHEGEHESAAMWKLYGQHESNIAVVTSMKMLRESMVEDKESKIHCGRVKYIDYKKDFPKIDHLLGYSLLKRKSFSHEKEVRLIMWDMPEGDLPSEKFDKERKKEGVDVPVVLDKLIVKILVSPKAAGWYVNTLRKVCDGFGLSGVPVTKSDLDKEPIE